MIVVVLREREGKAGGGKGFLLSDKSFTLSTSNFQTIFVIDATRVGDVRVSTDGIMQTVIQRWGTGGGNVPMIYPIDDGREVEKNQNGTGIGNEGDPAYTLDRQQAPAVAMAFDSYNQSLSDTSQTIRSGAAGNDHVGMVIAPSPAMAFQLAGDRDNPTISTSDVAYCLPANPMSDRGQSILSSTVRRLTPMECERLQGFPDGWTEGQADSHRYKQMGNAVAVPVVQWIIDRITKQAKG